MSNKTSKDPIFGHISIHDSKKVRNSYLSSSAQINSLSNCKKSSEYTNISYISQSFGWIHKKQSSKNFSVDEIKHYDNLFKRIHIKWILNWCKVKRNIDEIKFKQNSIRCKMLLKAFANVKKKTINLVNLTMYSMGNHMKAAILSPLLKFLKLITKFSIITSFLTLFNSFKVVFISKATTIIEFFTLTCLGIVKKNVWLLPCMDL